MTPVSVWADGVCLGVRVLGFWPSQGASSVDVLAYVDIGRGSDSDSLLIRGGFNWSVQQFVEFIGRRLEVQRLSWPFVQAKRDLVEVGLRVDG
jgi:hypothetical protein